MANEQNFDERNPDNEGRVAALTSDDVLSDFTLRAFAQAPFAMVITNPRIQDNPIVFVNKAFEEVSGYSRAAAVGRNCRFLQGEGTDDAKVQQLRDAIAAGEEVTVDLMNYQSDGSEFTNRLMISPLRDDDGEIVYYMGVQMRVDDEQVLSDRKVEQALSEIQHRVKNHLSIIVSMIRMQSRNSDAKEDFKVLSRRVETLQLLYEELSDASQNRPQNDETIALGSYLSRVANAIAYIDGRRGVRVTVEAESIHVPFEVATHLGLVLSEIMTNAMQHAFEDREEGLVSVSISELSSGVLRLYVADDGIGLPEGTDWPNDQSLGGRIVSQLVASLGGTLNLQNQLHGTIATLDIPANKARPN